ncbi:glycosyltransferase family 2 protein [Olivibacter ginsenosidimutans]|uniref:glycosyltransferase family 2 protein n=1 Tax=Olivibacter ginsenosidimutans TaxID=1176537 RepID=UPI003CD0923E
MIVSGLAAILCVYYSCVLLFLYKGWKRIPNPSLERASVKTKVSILIAARNEEAHIGKTITAILAQDYPKHLMELLVVDDHSTDRTGEIIASYKADGVKLIRLHTDQKLNSYKKKAISEAIAQSTGELIVATDADCVMGTEWLRTIVTLYETKGYKLISSPVIYHQEKSYFEQLQTLEFLYLIGLGAASIGLRHPSTCNGANLAYRRDIFYELGGFQGIDDLASGDDELFLHKVAQRYPLDIGFCKSEKAVVYTEAKQNLKAFLSQRRRWASKSTKYKNKGIVLLGVGIWLFNLFILVTAIGSFFSEAMFLLCMALIIVKMLAELFFLFPLTRFAHRQKLLLGLPLLSILHVFYMVYIGIAGNTGKYHWKGRLVR